VSASEEMSRDELVVVVARQAGQLAEQAEKVAAQDRQIAALIEANEALAAKLARLEHLLSRNSANSSSPPSRDDDPGKPAAPEKPKWGRAGPARARGKQPGAPGSHLAWTDDPDERRDRFPTGRCDCGVDLARARDLGVVDRYQCHEIPPVAVRITQYDQHQVQCGRCGRTHTAARPEGARPGPLGYGPNLAAFAVYLMVAHFVPAHRVAVLLESLTGTTPSVGFVHGLLARTAGLLGAVHDRIRDLITLAYAVCVDETPLKVGPRTPPPGKTKAERYLLVACTERYTHYLLGDRSLETFKASVLAERAERRSVVVHDRYQNYDNAAFAGLVHQLCCAHLLRDLDDATQVYPEAIWPDQIARALRALIHHANLAREAGRDQIAPDVRAALITRFRHGVLVGLSNTRHHGTRPGERKARLLLEVLHNRQADVLRFAHDLAVPATSNQAERDLRPSKCQQNVSGRLTSEDRTRDRYTIRGYLSTAVKHGHNAITVLRDALLGKPWMPVLPAPT
jgi:transposase